MSLRGIIFKQNQEDRPPEQEPDTNQDQEPGQEQEPVHRPGEPASDQTIAADLQSRIRESKNQRTDEQIAILKNLGGFEVSENKIIFQLGTMLPLLTEEERNLGSFVNYVKTASLTGQDNLGQTEFIDDLSVVTFAKVFLKGLGDPPRTTDPAQQRKEIIAGGVFVHEATHAKHFKENPGMSDKESELLAYEAELAYLNRTAQNQDLRNPDLVLLSRRLTFIKRSIQTVLSLPDDRSTTLRDL